jgi:uncharacterized membrane-anchored protein YhcB (DUF1043 family)
MPIVINNRIYQDFNDLLQNLGEHGLDFQVARTVASEAISKTESDAKQDTLRDYIDDAEGQIYELRREISDHKNRIEDLNKTLVSIFEILKDAPHQTESMTTLIMQQFKDSKMVRKITERA